MFKQLKDVAQMVLENGLALPFVNRVCQIHLNTTRMSLPRYEACFIDQALLLVLFHVCWQIIDPYRPLYKKG